MCARVSSCIVTGHVAKRQNGTYVEWHGGEPDSLEIKLCRARELKRPDATCETFHVGLYTKETGKDLKIELK